MTEQRTAVIDAVRKCLVHQRLNGIPIEVVENLVREDHGWWYVPVQPARQPDAVSPYYEVLARVEEQLDEQEDLNVLLVPTLPME